MFELGKLYSCSKYFLLLYPDRETAEGFYHAAGSGCTFDPTPLAAYWSSEFGKPVIYADKNIPLLVLNTEGVYVEVLAGDRKGWILHKYFLNIKEIAYAAA